MGENSKIAWCHHTWNPWWGCVRVSPGCDHCYADAWAKRTGHGDIWDTDKRRYFGDKHWNEPLKWNRKAEQEGIRYRVFCASMADVFDNVVEDKWRIRLFELTKATPHLDWLLLTKRIGNVPKMLPADWGDGYPNVWMGISVVNQMEAERDIQKLLRINAVIRWISAEPLLGSINVGPYLSRDNMFPLPNFKDPLPGLTWIVCGGESGPGARPCDVEWIRSIISQCKAAGVAVFCKQLGRCPQIFRIFYNTPFNGTPQTGTVYLELKDRKGGDPSEWPLDLRVRDFPRG